MTSTVRHRPGFVYGFRGYDPKALLRGQISIIWLYVGQTRQKPENRWHQHQYGSPNGEPPKIWWPLVTSREVIHESLWINDDKLDELELQTIATLLPLANIKGNMANMKRIPPWEMKALMKRIQVGGGVKGCVQWAKAKSRSASSAGWTLNQPSGQITWYGKDADRVGAKWLGRSIGSSDSSDSESESRWGSMWKKVVSGITGRRLA